MNGPREVEVVSPSASKETAAVVQGCVAILVLSVLVGASHRPADAVAARLSPWQTLFRLEPEETQRVYRELLSGLEEALRLRTAAAQWPSVARLSEDLVPPFSGKGFWNWEVRRLRSVVNYLGCPRPGSGHPAYLLQIQEDLPHPMNTPLDEFHRRTDDGSLIHVGIWVRPMAPVSSDAVVSPEREGWKEIVSGQEPAPASGEPR